MLSTDKQTTYSVRAWKISAKVGFYSVIGHMVRKLWLIQFLVEFIPCSTFLDKFCVEFNTMFYAKTTLNACIPKQMIYSIRAWKISAKVGNHSENRYLVRKLWPIQFLVEFNTMFYVKTT